MTAPLDHAIVVRHGPVAQWTTHAEFTRELAEAHARIRELEAALATATQTERARCLAICRNHQCSWSKHAENLRADENVDQAIRAENRARTAAQCAEEIERGWAVPTQETS